MTRRNFLQEYIDLVNENRYRMKFESPKELQARVSAALEADPPLKAAVAKMKRSPIGSRREPKRGPCSRCSRVTEIRADGDFMCADCSYALRGDQLVVKRVISNGFTKFR